MKKKDKEKCINPWVGLLIIVLICLLMSSAVIFEFRGKINKKNPGRVKNDAAYGAMQVVFPGQTGSNVYPNQQTDSIVF